jgi:energy-converting hydrogenase Eha subunit C
MTENMGNINQTLPLQSIVLFAMMDAGMNSVVMNERRRWQNKNGHQHKALK